MNASTLSALATGLPFHRGEVAGGLRVHGSSGCLDLALVCSVGIDAGGQRLRKGKDDLIPTHGSTSPAKGSQAVRAALYDAREAAPGRVASSTERMQPTETGQLPGCAQAARAAWLSWPRWRSSGALGAQLVREQRANSAMILMGFMEGGDRGRR